ncbi:hypothetical protein [Kitasatospora sp. DSM 101779]|uniref:hypothetical protein n=1 Tax=Kitasatospora sp. DSM 101779 TaxID=2853165 RepID=UPI0021D8F18A|nr:hypothetical protein [Kitasatospora sp. DSM 101779]MCU7827349.1 hypothetical protein [Kitasatospora sp. DSM 101779]
MENITHVNADLATEIELEAADTSFTFGEPRAIALDAGTEVELETADTSFTYGEPRV